MFSPKLSKITRFCFIEINFFWGRTPRPPPFTVIKRTMVTQDFLIHKSCTHTHVLNLHLRVKNENIVPLTHTSYTPPFLAHLSRRLEWTIVIPHRPSSVRPSVCLSVRPLASVRKLFTFSTSSPEPLYGFWWNLVGMKYSWSLTSVVVFWSDPSRGGSRDGAKIGHGGSPFFKKLLLQTGWLQRQTKWIAMI